MQYYDMYRENILCNYRRKVRTSIFNPQNCKYSVHLYTPCSYNSFICIRLVILIILLMIVFYTVKLLHGMMVFNFKKV